MLPVYVYVDIHQFIYFNDQFGHEAGDKVITKLEQHFESMFAKNIKRLGGNLWRFEMVRGSGTDMPPVRDLPPIRNMMEYAANVLHVHLNVVVSDVDNLKVARYLLKSATASGGNIALVMPS